MMARVFDGAGVSLGYARRVTTESGDGDALAVAGRVDGGFVVGWTRRRCDAVALRFAATGEADGEPFVLNVRGQAFLTDLAVASGADGRVIAVWAVEAEGRCRRRPTPLSLSGTPATSAGRRARPTR